MIIVRRLALWFMVGRVGFSRYIYIPYRTCTRTHGRQQDTRPHSGAHSWAHERRITPAPRTTAHSPYTRPAQATPFHISYAATRDGLRITPALATPTAVPRARRLSLWWSGCAIPCPPPFLPDECGCELMHTGPGVVHDYSADRGSERCASLCLFAHLAHVPRPTSPVRSLSFEARRRLGRHTPTPCRPRRCTQR
jgi:hypothetical protein